MRQLAVAVVGVMFVMGVAGCATGRYSQRSYAVADTSAMTVQDVIALSKADVSDRVIIDQIKATDSFFELGPEDLIELTNAGVSDTVISTMIKTEGPPDAKRYRGDYRPYYWNPFYYYPWYPSLYFGLSYWRPFSYYHYPYFGHNYGFRGGHAPGGRRSVGRHR